MLDLNYAENFSKKPRFNIADSAFYHSFASLAVDNDNVCIKQSDSEEEENRVIVQLERKIGSIGHPYSNSFLLNNSKRSMCLDSIGLEKRYSYRVIISQGNIKLRSINLGDFTDNLYLKLSLP